MRWDPVKYVNQAASTVRRELPAFALVSFGTFLVSFGIMALTLPYRLPTSGVAGIAVLTNYAFGISPAWVVGVGNIILLTWGLKELSLRFVGWTVYAVALMTALLKVMEGMPHPQLNELLLVAILAGVIKGLGGGLVLRSGSSLGGTDIMVVVLRKRLGIEVGRFSFYINLVILGHRSSSSGSKGPSTGSSAPSSTGL